MILRNGPVGLTSAVDGQAQVVEQLNIHHCWIERWVVLANSDSVRQTQARVRWLVQAQENIGYSAVRSV